VTGPDRLPRRARPQLLLLAASLVVALLLAEGITRSFAEVPYRPLRSADPASWRGLLHQRAEIPGLLYELAPNREGIATGVPIRTNSLGMRDDEPLAGSDVIRIAALGDSYTFGYGVPGELTYPNQLERLLNEADTGRRYEVWNLGVGGYCTRDEAIVLEHKVLVRSPDAILVGYYLNDPQTAPVQPLPGYFHGNEWWQHSTLLRLIAMARYERDRRRYGDGDYYRYLHNAPDRWPSALEGFERMGRLAAEAGLPILLVIFPVTPKSTSWSGYPYRDLHEKVRAAAENRGLEVLDLLDTWTRHPPQTLRLGERDLHPTPRGHLVTARRIQATWQARLASIAPDAAGDS
jgi:lysophospholipase L1-like esterase